MTKSFKFKIATVAVVVGVIFIFVLIDYLSSGSRIEPFGKYPAQCSEINNNLSKISSAKRTKIYSNKITVWGKFSPEKHLEKHPDDIAIRTWAGKDDSLVIILTNEHPVSLKEYLQQS